MRPPQCRPELQPTKTIPAGAHRRTVPNGCQRVDRAEEGRNDPTEETDAGHPASVVVRRRSTLAVSMLAASRNVWAGGGAPRRSLDLAWRRAWSSTMQRLSRLGRTTGTTHQSRPSSGPQGACLCWQGPQVNTPPPQQGRLLGRCGRTTHAQRIAVTSAPAGMQRGHWWCNDGRRCPQRPG